MKIEIQAPWQVNKYLKNTIQERVEKFTTYSDQIIHTDVFLKQKEHDSSPEDKIVEIRVSLPGPYIFAEGTADTFEKALARGATKIKNQLLKRKQKREEKRQAGREKSAS